MIYQRVTKDEAKQLRKVMAEIKIDIKKNKQSLINITDIKSKPQKWVYALLDAYRCNSIYNVEQVVR